MPSVSCDESRPCNACIKFGRTCIDDDTSIIATRKQEKLAASLLPAPRKIRPQPRINIPTSKPRPELECIPCQRDKETCTGGVTCRRCAELGERCMYGSRLSVFTKQRCALCRKKNKKCERLRPCVHCVRADVPCVDMPRKTIGVGLRVKRACAACRTDKTQCEES
jgi:Fungal Zn(2)-Cys(6) binuclear cluster domain